MHFDSLQHNVHINNMIALCRLVVKIFKKFDFKLYSSNVIVNFLQGWPKKTGPV